MSTFKLLLTVYIVGGLTFVPLVIGFIILFLYYTLPEAVKQSQLSSPSDDPTNLLRKNTASEKLVLRTATDDLAEKFHRKHDSDVAAGYFAVCREYVLAGVNGKPPERTSPAGEAVTSESPSVYQSMYRSIFDRSQKPTLEPNKEASITEGGTRKVKRANNVFYVVLRHGHLMLYDDMQQLEVRYVISLEYHDVDVFNGTEGEVIPEAELWTKRNAIRLRRRQAQTGERNRSFPFFFFSEHLSEKEDFYFALLKNQENGGKDTPLVQDYDTKDIITLVQKLHSTEEQLETRWLNAIIGRVFLAIYKTPFLEDLIRKKLTKKLSRVKKPNFITKLALQKIDPGAGGPFVTNPRLKDLSVNGDCMAEMDIEYNGNFRIEVAATARIDLGTRFKAREVDMVLAATCRKLTGHLLLRLKPQPSNRLWFSFEQMPKIDMVLEPVVSTRQITYGVILKALESRIMEVVAETLVVPFWDDVPFFDTQHEKFRGGIWQKETQPEKSTEIENEDPEDEAEMGKEVEKDTMEAIKREDRTMSMPQLSEARGPAALHAAKTSVSSLKEAIATHGPDKSPKPQAPRVMRSTSFASAADPTLSPTHADITTSMIDHKDARKRDSMLLDLTRSSSTSPNQSQPESVMTEPTLNATRTRTSSDTSRSSVEDRKALSMEGPQSTDFQRTMGSRGVQTLAQSISMNDGTSSLVSSRSRTSPIHDDHPKSLAGAARSLTSVDRKQAIHSINAAAIAAQRWGWGVLARNKQREVEAAAAREAPSPPPRTPMGRGQPLPPPGVPLPGPERGGLFGMPRRNATQSKRLPVSDSTTDTDSGRSSPRPPALPDRSDRRRRQASLQDGGAYNHDELLVVEAPVESNPNTPMTENHDVFFGHSEEPEQGQHGLQDTRKRLPLPVRRNDLEDDSFGSAGY